MRLVLTGLALTGLALVYPPSSSALLAKPTRVSPHETTRKLVVTQPTAHEHPAGKHPDVKSPAKHGSSSARATPSAGKSAHAQTAAARPSPSIPSKRLVSAHLAHGRAGIRPEPEALRPAAEKRVHAWVESQQKAAALAAIAASDEMPHRAPGRRLSPAAEAQAAAAVEMADAAPRTVTSVETYGPYVPFAASRPSPVVSGQRSFTDMSPAWDDVQPEVQRAPLRSIEEEASTPLLLPSLYDQRGRLVMPPPLKGSREILLHQNEVADRDGLDRMQNDTDILELRRKKKLVALPASDSLHVDERLPEDRRFARPWTTLFLEAMAKDHYARFHTPLQVDSAVRTVEVQQRLVRTNGNAAPVSGETASPHLTGQAVDIAKSGLTLPEIAWMRSYLMPLIQQGKIDVEEEFKQSCFHISVYKTYAPALPKVTVASARRAGTAGLAAIE